MKKKMMAALAATLLLTGGMSIGVLAGSSLQEIKAFLNGDLKIRVNGEITQFKDANGKSVLPITYNGTTYLPVRAASQALGVPVEYNNQANEVILGEYSDSDTTVVEPKQTALNKEDFNNTLYSKDPEQTTYDGTNYKEVLYSAPGVNIKYTALNPDGKYNKLYLQIGAVNGKIKSIEIKDLDKKALLKQVGEITSDSGMQTIEVDITGVKTITLNVDKEKDAGFIIPLIESYYQ